ncbi:hypothetical protein HCO57_01655 [Croceivirga sp. JEA036]|nr:hypothetical protein [Croceivirga sp. JEA036]
MFNDIDRHHKIVWQVVGVLIGSFAFIALAEKNIIPIDLAVTMIILVSLWVLAHVYDSNYWYNRNLVIISNIERQFLEKTDLKDIQYYFGEHRSKNSVQTSLKIQLYLVWAVIIVFLYYHFVSRIYSGLFLKWGESTIDWIRITPYITVIIFYYILVNWIKNKRKKNYIEFLENSPGKNIETESIKYGDGHPINNN